MTEITSYLHYQLIKLSLNFDTTHQAHLSFISFGAQALLITEHPILRVR